jgi:hypothetical protein
LYSGTAFAVLITVHNRSKPTITLLGADGPQPFRGVIERVAAQKASKDSAVAKFGIAKAGRASAHRTFEIVN